MLSGRRILDLMKLLTIQNEENMTSAVARIRRSLRGCKLRLSLGITLFEETGYCLDFLGFLIALPFLDRWVYHPVEILDRWGFYYADNALVFNWKNKYKFIHMPWDWDHCGDKHMVQLEDSAICSKCGKDFGWYCPISSKSFCEYTGDDECCVHCGEPEGRQ